MGVLVDELRAAVGADDGDDCERDESEEKNAAGGGGEICALAETIYGENGGQAGGDEHERFVDFEDALDGEAGFDGRLGEPSGKCGGECGESAQIKQADGGAVLIVIGAPDGENFKEKRGEPECDWKMNEERVNVEHGF